MRHKRVAGVRKARALGTVKSDIRVLEILEYLNRIGGEARVTDVVNALNLPQSSSSRCLAALTDAGFLNYDRFRRVYSTSARAALLSSDAVTRVFGSGDPHRLLEELRRLSGQTVVMSARNDTKVHLIRVEKGDGEAEPCFTVGYVSQLVRSACGRAMLSGSADTLINGLVRRYNAEVRTADQIHPDTVLRSVAYVREKGYLFHPTEAALETIGKRCRFSGSACPPGGCCMAKRRVDVVAPLVRTKGREVAVGVAIPPELEERHHDDYAAAVKDRIAQFAPVEG